MSNKQAPADHLLTTSVHEAFSWAPDMVVYHDKCADGIVAAWACWKRWGDAPEYLAANYGFEPPRDVGGKNILIVDFSYPAEQLLAMTSACARSIVILDHHKTAQAALEPFHCRESSPGAASADDIAGMLEDMQELRIPPIVALFDMERSGARMAWDFAHPGEHVPYLVDLAERYDLWKFEPGTMDNAECLHLAIQAGDMTIARMDALASALQDGDGPLIEGAAIYDWRTQLVAEIASRAHLRTVAGVEGVISVECPYSLVSAVGHHLLDKHPDAPFAAMSVTGEKAATWSLRSRDDRTDVSAVAKGQGGGGHRNPSTADAELDDATIRKLRGFGARNGWGRLIVGNLFAYRATDVADLGRVDDPVGPDNAGHVARILLDADRVVFAWGPVTKQPKHLRNTWRRVYELAHLSGRDPLCIGPVAKCGHPKHPLMLGYDLPMQRWEAPHV